MVWPILISVSVTPGAFSARAGHALVASAPTAAALDVKNVRRVFIYFPPFQDIGGTGLLAPPRRASAGDEVPEQHPALPIERRELHLPGRIIIIGGSVDRHAWQPHRQHE